MLEYKYFGVLFLAAAHISALMQSLIIDHVGRTNCKTEKIIFPCFSFCQNKHRNEILRVRSKRFKMVFVG